MIYENLFDFYFNRVNIDNFKLLEINILVYNFFVGSLLLEYV